MCDTPETTVGTPYPRVEKPKSEWTFREYLVDQIGFLEAIRRTEYGNGSLSAYKDALKEFDRHAKR
jgi:hypothetical protein